jgi:hypothetical protein
MAGSALEAQSTPNLIGWEWAPPPLPEPSAMRQQEPKWEEPLMLPPSPGMDSKTKGILILVGGIVTLILAFQAAGWLVVSLPLLIIGGVRLARAQNDPSRPDTLVSREDKWREYEKLHNEWSSAILREEAERQRRFAAAPRWYPIARIDPNRRMDIFGGGIEGWASFMHSAFSALLARGMPMAVLDLTRRDLARRALWPGAGSTPAPLLVAIPSQLQLYDPLVGTQHPSDIAALLTSSENPSDDWARRDIETGILRRTADALGGKVSLPRLLAGVTSLLAPDSPLVSDVLSAEERRTILDPNFIVMLGGDSAGHLGRMSAVLEAVVRRSHLDSAEVATTPQPLPFFSRSSTVISADPSGDPELRRRLDNLVAASLVDRLGQPEPCDGLLLIVGADRLSRSVLEGLISGAQERGLRLVMFFEHLRGEARELLGRGMTDTIVMQLGNYDDATTAANFIGKQHRFVVSSISLTVGTQFGGSDTHGFSITDSNSYTSQHMGPDSVSTGRSRGMSFNYSRTWAETENYGETSTRSEEFVARAEDIQRIPTTGFIYVTAVGGRQHVIFGDCHPAIAGSPLVAPRAIARR